MARLSGKGDTLNPRFLPGGQSGPGERPDAPAIWDAAQEAHSLLPDPSAEEVGLAGELGRSQGTGWGLTAHGSPTPQKALAPTRSLADSTKRPSREPRRTRDLQAPNPKPPGLRHSASPSPPRSVPQQMARANLTGRWQLSSAGFRSKTSNASRRWLRPSPWETLSAQTGFEGWREGT